MFIICQLFRDDSTTIDLFIENIQRILKVLNISKIYVFTDIDLQPINDVIVFKRKTKLKWKHLFKIILKNGFINKKGCFVIDPKSDFSKIDFNFQPDGVTVRDNYVFCKNIKKVYNVNRSIHTDYDFLKSIVDKDKIKVASICHVYYEDLIEEMIEYNKNLLKIQIDVDFYFCLVKNSSTVSQKKWVIDKIKKELPNSEVNVYDNKGLDIGTFLLSLKKIYNKKYDYIVKTHTKKSTKTSGEHFGERWRKDLLSILSINNIFEIENKILKKVDMIGSKKWKTLYNDDGFNKTYISKLSNDLKISYNNRFFIGGTMFWINFKKLSKYLTIEKIEEYYDLLEEGYFSQIDENDSEYLTHTFERLFGFMCDEIEVV